MAGEPIKSLADLPKTVREQAQAAQPFAPWNPGEVRKEALNLATVALREWLTARLEELVREKVARERVTVRQVGQRTQIRVDNVPRFEFKLKAIMETLR